MGGPVKNKPKVKGKDKPKKEVSRGIYLSMFYYKTLFEALIHSPRAS